MATITFNNSRDIPTCEQCGRVPSQCYAGGRYAGDWAGRYCYSCAEVLRFQVWDDYRLDSGYSTR